MTDVPKTTHTWEVIWLVIGLLILASVAVRCLKFLRPEKDHTELHARIRTWWIMAGLFLLAILLSNMTALVFFALISFLALKEYFSLIPTRRADRRVLFWAYLAIPVQYYWAAKGWYGMFVIFIPVYMFLFLPMRAVLVGETAGFLRSMGTVHWGLMTMVFSISHAAYLLVLKNDDVFIDGAGLVLYLVLLTQLNDVAQYIWGKTIGRRRVVPLVSPGKTWGGLLGGVFTTVLFSYFLAPHLTPLTTRQSLIAGLLIAVSGFVGDITISALKRDLGIKDSGTLLPGHGGILDRIDSLTYTAPLFFHYIRFLHF